MKRIAVIGAGMTGLSLAYYLSKSGADVDLFESQSRPGGLAGTFTYKGLDIDRFYHHFYTHDTELLDLIEDLGLSERLIWEATPTGMYYTNRIYKLSSPMDLIRFKPLSFLDRFRMGLLVLSSQRRKDFSGLENITAKDWIISKAGRKAYDIMWAPLLRNKFGYYSDKISAAWLWSKFTKRGASRSKTGKERLGYLKGGLNILINRFSEKLERLKVNLEIGKHVSSIIVKDGSADGLILQSGKVLKGYDSVISTLSTGLTSRLIPESFKEYKDSLLRIKYLANITLILFLKKSLSGYYWLNVNDPECPFVGVIEHTKMVGTSEYTNLSVVYIPKYLPHEDDLFAASKGSVFDKYLPWILKIFPGFDKNDVRDFFLCKDVYTQPVIETGYPELIPSKDTPIKNFHLVTMAQIYPDDRQLSNSVKHAKLFAKNFPDPKTTHP